MASEDPHSDPQPEPAAWPQRLSGDPGTQACGCSCVAAGLSDLTTLRGRRAGGSNAAGSVTSLRDSTIGEGSKNGGFSAGPRTTGAVFSAPNQDNSLAGGRALVGTTENTVHNGSSPGEGGPSPVVASRCWGLLETSFFTLRRVTMYLVPGSRPRMS